MRVTDKMIYDGAALRTGRARDEMEAASQEVSSGVRVQHPWDDPGAASQVIGHRAAASRADAIAQGAQRASDELNAADDALSGMNTVLDRVREIAVQFSNATYSPQERAAAANEINGLKAEALTYANTQFGGRYLFRGFKDKSPPFDATGAYAGDSGVRQVETAPGQFEDASVPGDAIFKGPNGGVDIFATISTLSTALANNDANGVNGSLNNIETSINQVVQARSKAGTAVNLFDTATSAAQAAKQASDAAASKLTDADVVTSASRLAFAQRALDASLTASAKSFELTLMDKLGK